MVDLPDPREMDPAELEWAAGLVEFLQWRNLTESMGATTANELLGITAIDPVVAEAVQIFDGERNRLRHEREMGRAEERARQMKSVRGT